MNDKIDMSSGDREFQGPENDLSGGERDGSLLFPLSSVRLRVTIGFVCSCAGRYGHAHGFTHLKLQKLLYYMQGFCVARTGTPLFTENIEAWRLGPVVREVWYECKGFGSKDLPVKDYTGLFSRTILDDYQLSIMRWVYSIRGQLSGNELVDKTHTERPWIKAWGGGRGGIIPLPGMARFFYRVNS